MSYFHQCSILKQLYQQEEAFVCDSPRTAGNWGKGNHVIVIVGADEADGRLRVINPYYNPDGGDTPMSVAELNKRGSLWRNCDASVMVW